MCKEGLISYCRFYRADYIKLQSGRDLHHEWQLTFNKKARWALQIHTIQLIFTDILYYIWASGMTKLIEFFIKNTFIMLMHAFINTSYVKYDWETVMRREHGVKSQMILNQQHLLGISSLYHMNSFSHNVSKLELVRSKRESSIWLALLETVSSSLD